MKSSYMQAAPGVADGLFRSGQYLATCGLEERVRDLVAIRASQINGCAFCLELHVREAKESGETDARLHTIAAWRDTPFFSDRERAALLWTERLTLLAGSPPSPEDEALVEAQFSPKELADLTLAITVINSWNRLNVAFHHEPDPTFHTGRAVAVN